MSAPSPLTKRVAALALVLAAPALAQSGAISLTVGQQKTLRIDDVARVAIGDPDVADVKQVGAGNELLLTGVGDGRTTLLVWDRGERRSSYVVLVRRLDPREVVSEVRAFLGDREGVQVRVVGDRIVLEGETLTAADHDRVQQVLAMFPQIRSFVRPSAAARRLAAETITRALQKAGIEHAQATAVGGTLLLEGTVDSKEELQKVELVVQALGEKAENLLAVSPRRMVLVEVEFVEVSAGATRLVGIKPPSSIASAPGTGVVWQIVRPLPGDQSTETVHSLSGTAAAGIDFSAAARFDDSSARVLARPRLLCASGDKAEFTAGGEIPLPIVTQNQIAVEWKKFGIQLRITPTADGNGNIAAAIEAEVSDIDPTLAVRANGFDVPGLRTREVKTSVAVREGETIILSGLLGAAEDKDVSKIPLLGHIPILGELFKSRRFAEHKTELAIFVTPRLATPSSERVRSLVDGARKEYQDARGSVSFRLLD
jgi:pilus assembly protein CpaC